MVNSSRLIEGQGQAHFMFRFKIVDNSKLISLHIDQPGPTFASDFANALIETDPNGYLLSRLFQRAGSAPEKTGCYRTLFEFLILLRNS
ncbi:hypothetical protein SAMN05444359_1214 [Neolewinella agarilytica]|uniref:Uncharacterized protein n=1 Tax=Neolewinella agarilytica TaxID=478744 RepID=A0A1H9KKD4_9BACT|nr:hypothetical protein SAMN05444359_1214 [Neolewinella agarilytica]